MTLEQQLLGFLSREWEWHSKGSILNREWKNQRNFTRYLPSTVDRALRKLEESSKIAVRYEGKNTKYKWLNPERRGLYIPTSYRNGEELFKKV